VALLSDLGRPRIDERFVSRKGGKRLVRSIAFDRSGKVLRVGGELSREEAEGFLLALNSILERSSETDAGDAVGGGQ